MLRNAYVGERAVKNHAYVIYGCPPCQNSGLVSMGVVTDFERARFCIHRLRGRFILDGEFSYKKSLHLQFFGMHPKICTHCFEILTRSLQMFSLSSSP